MATYANAKSLARKSDAELEELQGLGLTTVYMGLESGDDAILRAMNKNGDSAFIVEQGQRARRAGMKLNVTVINGLGGVDRSMDHARATAEALNALDPEQVAALSLMLVPGTTLHDRWERGEFVLPDAPGMLAEIREMLVRLDLSRGCSWPTTPPIICRSRSGCRPARRLPWPRSITPCRAFSAEGRIRAPVVTS